MKKRTDKPNPPTEAGRRHPIERPSENRPQAFSYHANRATGREATASRETVAARPQAPRPSRRHWFMLAGFVAIMIIISVQSTTPTIKLSGSADSRRLLQAEQTYQSAAAEQLDGSILNHIKYAVNTNALADALRKQFPELTAVTVSETLLANRPIITVAGYEPALIMSSSDGSYVVDETGVSRMTSARLPDSVRANLPVVTDQSGLPLTPGSGVLPATNVEFINQITAGLKAANIGFEQMTLPPAASELDVKIAGKPYTVKFAMQGGASAQQQIGTYIAAQARVGGASQYVDVRVPERLYYK